MSHKVVAIAYDRLCTFEFGCAVELFALPRPELPVAWYDFAVCAAERGPIRATGAAAHQAAPRLRARRTPVLDLFRGVCARRSGRAGRQACDHALEICHAPRGALSAYPGGDERAVRR